jgi:hypothetical protein
MTTREFHIGEIMSVAGHRLVSVRGIAAVYDVCDFMTGDSNMTHQLPRVMRECRPVILRQHPELAEAVEESSSVNRDNWQEWVACWAERYGGTLSLAPMAEDEHERIDPLSELAERISPGKIMVVKS